MDYLESMFNDYLSMAPAMVKGIKNAACEMQKRFLYTKLFSVFQFNLPKDWEPNFFRFFLFRGGSIGVIYTQEFGWICNPYSVEKLGLYYKPSIINVTSQFLTSSKTGVIGVNAGIVHIMDDYAGLDDLVTFYAEQLAEIDKSINVNLMNCNVATMFEAENKKQAEEVKLAYSKATQGEPMVVVNKDVMQGKQLTTLISDPKSTFIIDQLLTARRTIVNNFLTEVGIKNANYDKKERLNSQEVEENNDETSAIVNVILDNIKRDFDAINAISDLNLSVELRYNYEEVMEDVESNIDGLL